MHKILPPRIRWFVAASFLPVLILTGCADAGGSDDDLGDGQNSDQPASLSLAGPAPAWNGWAYTYVADDMGYFSDVGIDMQIHPGMDTATSMQLLSAGTVEFGITSLPILVKARNQGAPVTAIAAMIPQNMAGIVARHDLGFETPADFEGKTIGNPADPNVEAQFGTMLESVGLSPKDVNIVEVNIGGLTAQLVDGTVDGGYAFDFAEGKRYEDQTGEEALFFRFTDYGVPDMPHYILAANDEFLDNSPKVAARATEAMLDGQEYMRQHPEYTADLLTQYREGVDAATHERELAAMEQYWETPYVRKHGMGALDPSVLEESIAWLGEQKVVDSAHDASFYYTNKFVPGFD